MGFTIKVELGGLQSLMKRLEALDGTEVEDGFFEEDSYGPENNNLPVALVAYLNEYGHSLGPIGVPERPFMHDTYGDRMNQFHMARAMRNVFIAAIVDGRGVDRLLSQLGRTVGDLMEEAIIDYPGSNSPATVKRKGFNDPLRNTDKMLNSVKFQIHKGGRTNA